MEPDPKVTAGGWSGLQLKHDLLSQSFAAETEPTIFQPPASIRRTSPDDFEPKAVHLGLHNRKPYSVADSDELKVAVARGLLLHNKGAPACAAEQEWNKLVSKVVSSPQDARKQYEIRAHDGEAQEAAGYLDPAALDDDAVANILTLDALFVVAFLQVSSETCKIARWELIFREPRFLGLSNQMETELGMLQNQVPLSCLQGAVRVILEVTSRGGDAPLQVHVVMEELERLLRHAVTLLYPLAHDGTLGGFIKTTYTGKNSLVHCKHILDCLYRVFSETLYEGEVGGGPRGDEVVVGVGASSKETRLIVEIEETAGLVGKGGLQPLQESGADQRALISFESPVVSAKTLKFCGVAIRSEPCRLSGIRFVNRRARNAFLVLPQLQVYDTTAGELRNLAVYECLAYPLNGHVRKYMRFMNDLITTAADAELLVRAGAIVSYVGGLDEIVSIWSALNHGITLPFSNPDSSVEIAEIAIHRHCRKLGTRWIAGMTSQLCGGPTLFFSAVFAILLLLLLLTAAQTYVAFQ